MISFYRALSELDHHFLTGLRIRTQCTCHFRSASPTTQRTHQLPSAHANFNMGPAITSAVSHAPVPLGCHFLCKPRPCPSNIIIPSSFFLLLSFHTAVTFSLCLVSLLKCDPLKDRNHVCYLRVSNPRLLGAFCLQGWVWNTPMSAPSSLLSNVRELTWIQLLWNGVVHSCHSVLI